MKVGLISVIICLFSCNVQSQTIGLKDFLRYIGYGDITIGMSLEEFKKFYENATHSGFTSSDEKLYSFSAFPNASNFLTYKCNSEVSINQKNILTSISWQLYNKLGSEILDTLHKLLGTPNSETDYLDNIGDNTKKIIWLKDNFLLTAYYRKDFNSLYIKLEKKSVFRDKPREDIIKEKEGLIKTNRTGKGNGTFNLSLNFLERIIMNNLNYKSFEQFLPLWNSYESNNSVSLTYNKKTKRHDIPVLNITYSFHLKQKDIIAKIEVKRTITKSNFIH